MFWKRRNIHKIAIIYKDHVDFREVEYPKDGIYKLQDGTAYYLDPAKKNHVFVHGYVNEIDGAEFHEMANKIDLEPSYTFLNAYNSRILEQMFKNVEGSQFDEIVMYAFAAALVLEGFLIWNVYQNLDKLLKFLGVG